MSTLQIERDAHPVAEIFPPMSDAEHSDLVTDIREHGLHEPIWLHRDGRIIDGRNRYRACALASVEPSFRTYDGAESELVAFVVSLNLKRRHLNETQRAMVAARIANLRNGQRADRPVPSFANLQSLPLGIEPAEAAAAIPRAEAARMLNVSPRSIASAREVIDHGVPELVDRVERGDLAVSTAAAIAGAPHEEQREVASLADKREQRERAQAIKARSRPARPGADKRQALAEAFVPSDRARRRQELNKVVEKAQATFAALSDFSEEELALFIGETPSIRSLLALLRDQYAAWFDLALTDRPHVRPAAGGTA
jgi:ParB-like chromosome segregation protein Spo0J